MYRTSVSFYKFTNDTHIHVYACMNIHKRAEVCLLMYKLIYKFCFILSLIYSYMSSHAASLRKCATIDSKNKSCIYTENCLCIPRMHSHQRSHHISTLTTSAHSPHRHSHHIGTFTALRHHHLDILTDNWSNGVIRKEQ